MQSSITRCLFQSGINWVVYGRKGVRSKDDNGARCSGNRNELASG